MPQDEEHLRLLAIFHYVVGGLAALFAMLPIFHLIFGLMLVFAPDAFAGKGEPPPAFLGWFLMVFASMVIITGWIFAACLVAAGRSLAQHKRYMFCLVMACFECIFMPFGTVLGVFTIVVLMRDSVKQLFAVNT